MVNVYWRLVDRPMLLLHHDGTRPVPTGGVLFLTTSDQPKPTDFPDTAAALAAVDRSVRHRQALGYTDSHDRYEIMDPRDRAHLVQAEREARRRRRTSPLPTEHTP